MSNPITITVTAQTAQAAAALQQLAAQGSVNFQQLQRTMGAVGKSADEAGQHIAGMSYYARSAIDQIRFAAMGGGDRAAFYAVDELTRGLLASGMALSEMLPMFATIGIAVGAGVEAWRAWNAASEAAKQETLAVNEALSKLPTTLKQIQEAASAGLLSQNAATQLAQLLTGQQSYKVRIPVSQALMQGRITAAQATEAENQYDQSSDARNESIFQAQLRGDTAMISVEADLAERAAMVNQELVRRGYLVEELDDKGKETGKYVATAAGQALLEEMDLQKKVSVEAVAGIERERLAAKQKFDDEMAQYRQMEEAANAKLPGGQTPAQLDLLSRLPQLKKEIADAYQTSLAEINAKEVKDEKVTISPEEMRSRDAQAFAEQNKQIEDRITQTAMTAGRKREEFYKEEYAERLLLATQALYSGEISEQQYNDAVRNAQQQMLAGQKAVNDELLRQQQLERQNQELRIGNQIKAIQDNPNLTDTQKQQQEAALYAILLRQNQAYIAQLTAQKDLEKDAEKRLELEREILELQAKNIDLGQKQQKEADPNSFSDQMGLMLTDAQNLQVTWKDVRDQVDGISRSAMTDLNNQLARAIVVTGNFHKMWIQIGETIMTQLVEAVLTLIEKELVALAVQELTLAVDVLIKAVTGYAEGGYTGDGPSDEEAGIVHRGEYVMPKTAVQRIGLGNLRAMHEGNLTVDDFARAPAVDDHAAMFAQGRGQSGGLNVQGHKVSIFNVNDRSEMLQAMKSSDGQQIIINHVRNNRLKIGIGT